MEAQRKALNAAAKLFNLQYVSAEGFLLPVNGFEYIKESRVQVWAVIHNLHLPFSPD